MERVLDMTTEATDILERLGSRLGANGYLTMLDTGSAHPRLDLVDRHRPSHGATILCEPGPNGYWLWWAWAERIGPAGDLDTAIVIIDLLLRRADAA